MSLEADDDNCPLCGEKPVNIGRLNDDRYGFPGTYPLFKCSSCGHKSLKGEFSEQLLRKLYTEYYPRSVLNLESYKLPKENRFFREKVEVYFIKTKNTVISI